MIRRRIDSQTFNDGICRIYAVGNVAAPGDKPVKGLTLKVKLRYDSRTVGISRYTDFMQAGAQVDHVIRMPRRKDVSTQDVCELEDGSQYSIEFVQHPKEVRPKCMDLTLQKIEVKYGTPKDNP